MKRKTAAQCDAWPPSGLAARRGQEHEVQHLFTRYKTTREASLLSELKTRGVARVQPVRCKTMAIEGPGLFFRLGASRTHPDLGGVYQARFSP